MIQTIHKRLNPLSRPFEDQRSDLRERIPFN